MKQAIGKAVLLAAGEDGFIPMAKRQKQLEWMGLSAERIAETVKKLIPNGSMADPRRKEIIRQGKTI
jgi:hypothetical protein